ncbi:hypothetical protein F2Q69_00046761 [Brassica cretica]|uniref:Uncharacterized protein n=1 Tax=Brassica cretica TaxID=69181 RepID=A0A8S9Q2M5_BRACR|nr:hypothetical protein F2Q69_00046760 [Brassica cretica]KAF3526100.1 hypothetical protein F2Q69_00046761 [Brassica cretica]
MVRGDAPVRSSDLRTSVSWLIDKVKGVRILRLNQDGLETTSGQLNSAWRSVPVRDRLAVTWAVMEARLGDGAVAWTISLRAWLWNHD